MRGVTNFAEANAELTAVLATGERQPLDIDAYVTVARNEIPWHDILPSRICSGLPAGTVIETVVEGVESATTCG